MIYLLLCSLLISGRNVLEHHEHLLFMHERVKKMISSSLATVLDSSYHRKALPMCLLGLTRDWLMRSPMQRSDWSAFSKTLRLSSLAPFSFEILPCSNPGYANCSHASHYFLFSLHAFPYLLHMHFSFFLQL